MLFLYFLRSKNPNPQPKHFVQNMTFKNLAQEEASGSDISLDFFSKKAPLIRFTIKIIHHQINQKF